MAWAEQIPGSGRWRGLYRVADSTRKHTAPGGPFPTKAEALRRAGAEEDEARRTGATRGRASQLTWSQWADQWWTRRPVEPGTLRRDESRRTAHLEPRWGQTLLRKISRDDVQDWVDSLDDAGLAASTVGNCYHLLSASMKAAMLAGKIATTPCVSIRLPIRPPTDERFLTFDQVSSIAHFLGPAKGASLVWLLAGTGMRWGEAVGAHRHRLDLDAARVDVHEVWDQKDRTVKPYPKGRRKRSVPLPGWLVAYLDEHMPPAAGRCGAVHRSGSTCRSPLILPGRGGVPVDYDSWRRSHWERVVGRWMWVTARGERFRSQAEAWAKHGPRTRLQRTWTPGLVDVGPCTIHDLRHSYASWLIQDGVSLEALSDLLGHSSLQVTQRYAHLSSSQWTAVRAVLDGRAAPLVPQTVDSGTEARSQFRPETAAQ